MTLCRFCTRIDGMGTKRMGKNLVLDFGWNLPHIQTLKLASQALCITCITLVSWMGHCMGLCNLLPLILRTKWEDLLNGIKHQINLSRR
jgi:hypothetical protein